MKSLLLICHNEQEWGSLSESEREQIYGEYRQLRGQLTGNPPVPIERATADRSATAVRRRSSSSITDVSPRR
jgi:hypothetical protein